MEHLAAWWLRVAAFVIDFAIGGALAFGVLFLGGAITGERDHPAFVAVFWLVIVLYSPVLVARGGRRNGQTLGRQLVGVRIVPERGGAMSFSVALVRHLLHAVLWIIPLIGLLNDLWPLFDAKKQTVHDKAAGTLVAVAQA